MQFASLDAKLCRSLSKVCSGDFQRSIGVIKDEAAALGNTVSGRQILFLIYGQFAARTGGTVA